MFISKFGGVYFWLVYHVTPHMLQMTTLRMKFSGAFLDNDFALCFLTYILVWYIYIYFWLEFIELIEFCLELL